MDDQVSTLFYVTYYRQLLLTRHFTKSESTWKITVIRDRNKKCSNGESELQIFVLLGATLLTYYFAFNSLLINPPKILCNKELALSLPQITASCEQKPVSKICVFCWKDKVKLQWSSAFLRLAESIQTFYQGYLKKKPQQTKTHGLILDLQQFVCKAEVKFTSGFCKEVFRMPSGCLHHTNTSILGKLATSRQLKP